MSRGVVLKIQGVDRTGTVVAGHFQHEEASWDSWAESNVQIASARTSAIFLEDLNVEGRVHEQDIYMRPKWEHMMGELSAMGLYEFGSGLDFTRIGTDGFFSNLGTT